MSSMIKCTDGEIKLTTEDVKNICSRHKGSYLNTLVNKSDLKQNRVSIDCKLKQLICAVECYKSDTMYVDLLCQLSSKEMKDMYDMLCDYFNIIPAPKRLSYEQIMDKASVEFYKLVHPLRPGISIQLGGTNAFNLLVGAPLENKNQLNLPVFSLDMFTRKDDPFICAFFNFINDWELVDKSLSSDTKVMINSNLLVNSREDLNSLQHIRGKYVYVHHDKKTHIITNDEKLDKMSIMNIVKSGKRGNNNHVVFDYVRRNIITNDRNHTVNILDEDGHVFSEKFTTNPFTSVMFHPDYGFTSKYLVQLVNGELSLTPEEYVKYRKYIKKYSGYIRVKIRG